MSQKRTILVTGCSDGGLGSALALALHAQGWRVFASARSVAKLTETQAVGIESVQMDVSSDASVAAAVDQVRQLAGGSLDGLVNNAGGGYSMPLLDVDLARARDNFELNVFSLVRVTQAFAPLLLQSPHGALVANKTSGSGILGCGTPFMGTYNAAKAAACSITETLRLELQPFGVRVVNLVTGGVKSGFFSNAPTDVLPDDSIYGIARGPIEEGMGGTQPGMVKVDTAVWAAQVAKDLSQSKPPAMVWRGGKAGTVRLVAVLPTGTGDSVLKKMSGLDVLERNIKQQGLEKVRQGLAK